MTVDEALNIITELVGRETYPYSCTELTNSIVFDYRNYHRILVTVTSNSEVIVAPQIFIGLDWKTISILDKSYSLKEWLSWLYN